MERVIDGKRYNTKTATELCDVSGPNGTLSVTDFAYNDTHLYRTKSGRYFIAGEGGARSRWAKPCGNDVRNGEGLQPIDEAEARRLCEQFGSVETYCATFGEPEEA